MGFNEAYKVWRNQARRYTVASIIGKVFRLMRRPVDNNVEALRIAPWQLLLMVKWVCQDRMASLRIGEEIGDQQFDDLRQRLWDMPSVCDLGTRDTLPGLLFFRQLVRPQIDYQRRATPGMLREAALLATQPGNSRLRRRFLEKTGLEVEQFMGLAYDLYSQVTHGALNFDFGSFEFLRQRYSAEAVDAFIRNIALDFDGLVAMFRELPDAREKVASEYYEASPLRRFPLFRVGGALLVWQPTVLYRGLEGFVHSVLAEEGQAYMDEFSRLFERHVIGEASAIAPRFITEAELRAWLPAGAKIPDGLMAYPDCNVFVESKAGIFDESVMTVGHSDLLRSRTATLVKAVAQGRSASNGIRNSETAPEDLKAATRDYLLVVTNKELGAGSGARLASMYPPGTLPADSVNERLPLSRIYVLSIEDFERFAAAARSGHIDVPAFLDDCVASDANPVTSVYFFDQHLDRAGAPHELSHLVAEAEHRITE